MHLVLTLCSVSTAYRVKQRVRHDFLDLRIRCNTRLRSTANGEPIKTSGPARHLQLGQLYDHWVNKTPSTRTALHKQLSDHLSQLQRASIRHEWPTANRNRRKSAGCRLTPSPKRHLRTSLPNMTPLAVRPQCTNRFPTTAVAGAQRYQCLTSSAQVHRTNTAAAPGQRVIMVAPIFERPAS